MSQLPDDTQRKRPPQSDYPSSYRDDIPAPPRFLMWLVVGVFFTGVLGAIAGVVIFRFSLEPAQQERVISVAPFMEAFLPPRPAAGDTLPTPESSTSEDISPDDLLSGLFDAPADTTPATEEPRTEPESAVEPPAVAVVPTATLEPTPEPTLAPTATLEPTPEPTLAPTQTPEPVSEPAAVAQTVDTTTTANDERVSLPARARMSGFVHAQQTWNNCGPANITMALSYYGWTRDQRYAEQFLKPGGREDKNVSPWEMVEFVNTRTQVRALTRVGGDLDVIRAFIANGVPVVIETGYMPEGYDWMGHYQTIVGYDNNLGIFWIYDSFLGSGENGEGVAVSYAYMDSYWRHFNRRFIVVYEPQREALVRDLLGDLADPRSAAEHALRVATDEATANPRDGHAWFNMGASLTQLGEYQRAATAFDRARREGLPWRMTWYQFEPFEAYYEANQLDDLMALINSNLSNGADYVEETYYWQGRAFAKMGRINDAATAFRMALRRNPRYQAAQDALNALGL